MKLLSAQETLGGAPDRDDAPLPARWRIETIDPLSGTDWDRAAQGFQGLTVFHTSAWARVLSRTYGHVPHYLKIFTAERPLALVPIMELDSRWTGRRGVCLPFSDGCGPLWVSDDPSDVAIVHDALACYAG
jgi:hypothetical protein